MNVEVSNNISVLTESTGFWSSNKVLFNTTSNAVIIDETLNTHVLNYVFEKHIEKIITEQVSYAVRQALNGKHGSMRHGFDFTSDMGFDSRFFTINGVFSWQKARTTLIEDGYYDVSKYFTELWLSKFNNCRENGLNQIHLCPSDVALLHFSFKNVIHKLPVNEVINDLIQIATIPAGTGLNNEEFEGLMLVAEKYVTRLSPKLSDNIQRVNCNNIASSATRILALLHSKKILLLPRGLSIWRQSAFRDYASTFINPTSDSKITPANQFTFLCNNTMDNLEDVPVDVRGLQGPADSYIYASLSAALRHYGAANLLPVWPIDRLRYVRPTSLPMYSPGWCRNSKLPPKWITLVEYYYNTASASETTKLKTLRSLISWGWLQLKLESPWDIKAEMLRNPYRPSDKNTYYFYLHGGSSDASWSWGSAERIFSVAVASSKLKDSPFFGIPLINPFDDLENPFKNTVKPSKTHRRRIPQNILEAMIDTLLEPDENGIPTYEWAKNATFKDKAYLADNHNNGAINYEWFPSRCSCLALLLLTPIRGAQGRWLDWGLLDETIYNPDTGIMEINTHPLTQFRYKNGNTHKKQCGRNTGVIQMSYDEITGLEEPVIYITTNKTQLWDPIRKSGYEIPWPDGKRLVNSESIELKEKGHRLGMVYNVLRNQLKWLRRYAPSCSPISFIHVPEDKRRVDPKEVAQLQLPMFVPMFMDFNYPVTYKHEGETYQSFAPVTKEKLVNLFNSLAIETEKRMRDAGYNVTITRDVVNESSITKVSAYDVHSLRVTGISNLIEMGVPAHIVSEFVAGHMSLVMTLHYFKTTPAHLREEMYNAWEKNGSFDFEEDISHAALIQKCNIRAPFVSEVEWLDDITLVTRVLGGLCLTGGKGTECNEGAIYIKDETTEYGPVLSGCGNCRYFVTGTPFLLEQAHAANDLMLKMRILGREQNKLHMKRNELAVRLDNSGENSGAQRIENEIAMVRGQIQRIENDLLPIISDWYNRFTMFVESEKILKLSSQEKQQPMTIFAREGIEAFSSAPQRSEASDFELVRTIVEHARVLKSSGISIPEDAGRMLRESMDIILSSIGSSKLFLQVADTEIATTSASMLANLLSQMVGDEAIQDHIDSRNTQIFEIDIKDKILELSSTVIDAAKRGDISTFGSISSQAIHLTTTSLINT